MQNHHLLIDSVRSAVNRMLTIDASGRALLAVCGASVSGRGAGAGVDGGIIGVRVVIAGAGVESLIGANVGGGVGFKSMGVGGGVGSHAASGETHCPHAS